MEKLKEPQYTQEQQEKYNLLLQAYNNYRNQSESVEKMKIIGKYCKSNKINNNNTNIYNWEIPKDQPTNNTFKHPIICNNPDLEKDPKAVGAVKNIKQSVEKNYNELKKTKDAEKEKAKINSNRNASQYLTQSTEYEISYGDLNNSKKRMEQLTFNFNWN